ncbi:hypothetical protein MMC13_000261 [Lambiella insularis]|nr:hypothetical protein [Lambiella insularis]
MAAPPILPRINGSQPPLMPGQKWIKWSIDEKTHLRSLAKDHLSNQEDRDPWQTIANAMTRTFRRRKVFSAQECGQMYTHMKGETGEIPAVWGRSTIQICKDEEIEYLIELGREKEGLPLLTPLQKAGFMTKKFRRPISDVMVLTALDNIKRRAT